MKRYKIDARKIEVLRGHQWRVYMMGDNKNWLCHACGARAKQYLFIKHSKKCLFMAQVAARKALLNALEGRGK